MYRSTTLLLVLLFFNFVFDVSCKSKFTIPLKSFVFWPNATIPFYINPDHFDHEQSLAIMTALSVFSFKTCLKFLPTMSPPEASDHVLLFSNPEGKRRFEVKTEGHSVFEPHILTLGYDCLKSPCIDMMIMKALGFPFEHNRPSRDLFIEVLMENIQPGAIELFTKDTLFPIGLRSLPYDQDSVMHFGTRDYSKNGHKTIIFKNPGRTQNRVGLTDTDLRKIEIVYGPECLTRDRQAKIELCQSYPGVARRKRSIQADENLRINPQITPFPINSNATKSTATEKSAVKDVLQRTVEDLEVAQEMETLANNIEDIISLALLKAKIRHCNGTKTKLHKINITATDLSSALGIIANLMIYNIEYSTNQTGFCSKDHPLITRCGSGPNDRCRQTYKSTKSGNLVHYTQHRPTFYVSTNHYPLWRIKNLQRAGDDVKDINTTKDSKKDKVRKKRSTTDKDVTGGKKDSKDEEKKDMKGEEKTEIKDEEKKDIKNEENKDIKDEKKKDIKEEEKKDIQNVENKDVTLKTRDPNEFFVTDKVTAAETKNDTSRRVFKARRYRYQ